MLPEIIASMTSYPARIDTVHLAVESLLNQSVRADKVILWLADSQFPGGFESLPEPLRNQTARGLTIRWCDDLRSYKRQYFAFRDYPDAAIIIVDDDLIYPPDMIETLCESFKKHPHAVSAMRVHLMRFDDSGSLMPYNSWYYEYSGLVDVPSMALYATPGGGTLVPPGAMHEAAFDLDNIKLVCPTADDIWMKLMYTLTGTPVVLAAENRPLLEIPETQEQALWRDNCVRNESDRQRTALLQKYDRTYGEKDTLVSRMRRDANVKPQKSTRLSVIIAPCDDKSAQDAAINSAIAQRFDDMEIIVTCQTDAKDSRVRRVSSGKGIMRALGAATLQSRGDYVIYLMPYERLSEGACARAVQMIDSLETDKARLKFDIIDTRAERSDDLRGTAICSAMPWDAPEKALSGWIMRGALCRLVFRFADTERYGGASPAAAAFIASICAKRCCRRAEENMVITDAPKDIPTGDSAQAVCCAGDFIHRMGGEEAYGTAFAGLCSGLSEENGAVNVVADVLQNALKIASCRRDSLKAQLAEAASVAEQRRSTVSIQSRSCDEANRRAKDLENQLNELKSSSIFKAGRIVTFLPRKCRLLIDRLRG